MKRLRNRIFKVFKFREKKTKTNHNICVISKTDSAPKNFINQMLKGKKGGIVIKNLMDKDKLDMLKNLHHSQLKQHALKNGEEPYVTFPFNYAYQSYVDPKVGKDYFKNLASQIKFVNECLGFDLVSDLKIYLSQIDPTWTMEPKGSQYSGLSFTPFTLRKINNENQVAMGAHLENGMLKQFEFINTKLNSPFRTPFLSLVIMLEKREGGRLTLFNRIKDPSEPVDFNDKTHIELDEGDLLLFHGGETYHNVEPIIGNGTRQTLGSFINVIPETKTLEFWV